MTNDRLERVGAFSSRHGERHTMSGNAYRVQHNAVLWERLRQLHRRNAEAYDQDLRSGKFRTPMFTFTRAVRLELPLANEEEAVAIVEGALRSWDDGIEDPWRHWFPASADPLTEFRQTWRKIRTNTLELALRRAEALPLKPRIHESHPNWVKFLSIAFHLQIERGVAPIFLPCGAIGDLLNVDRKVVWRYRRFACQLGLLLLTLHSTARDQADEFRFGVELFDRHTGEQVSGTTQSWVAPATHEIPEIGFINRNPTQEFHEKSWVAPSTHERVSGENENLDLPVANRLKNRLTKQLYIPNLDETAVILQEHQQRMAAQRQVIPRRGNLTD
jgi:hypothetical protein